MNEVTDIIPSINKINFYESFQPSNTTVLFPTKILISNSLLIILSLITLFISILSLVKVYRLFKWTDLALSFSTIFISLSVICLIFRLSMNIALRLTRYQTIIRNDTVDNVALA